MTSRTPIFVLRELGMDDCFKKWKMEVENSQCKFFQEYKFASPEEVLRKHVLWIATEQLEEEGVLGARQEFYLQKAGPLDVSRKLRS